MIVEDVLFCIRLKFKKTYDFLKRIILIMLK